MRSGPSQQMGGHIVGRVDARMVRNFKQKRFCQCLHRLFEEHRAKSLLDAYGQNEKKARQADCRTAIAPLPAGADSHCDTWVSPFSDQQVPV